MYFINNDGSGQLKWSLLFIIINVYHVIGLPLSSRHVGQQQTLPPQTDIDIPLLTLMVNSIKNVQIIGQRLYKRWRMLDCPNLEVAVYGDCFVKSEITLIAAVAAASSVLVGLICYLCRRHRRLEEQAYRNYLLEGGSVIINGQLWENGYKSEPLPPPPPRTENWNWFKERRKRKQREREERWAREREREIERRRKREKKKKGKRGKVGGK